MNYSVLTSVYAKEKADNLKLSIDSILKQSLATDDYVIVKDGPLTEELESVLKYFDERYECINIVTLNDNMGLGYALNEGLKVCKNELIARMDTDDIAIENRCELQIDEFNKDNKLDIVGSYMYEFYEDPNEIISIKKVPKSHNEIYEYGKRRNPFNHPTVMYRKSTVLKYDGYSDMRQGQDHELFNRMLRDGCKGKNIDKALVKFRSNIDMHKRRKSINSVKSYIKVIYDSWRANYSTIFDLGISIILQVGLLIIPNKIGILIYRKLFRD